MRAYLYDNVPGDQREPHDSGSSVDIPTLESIGVYYARIPVDEQGQWEKQIEAFAKERNYKNKDKITVTKAGLGDAYESKIKSFFDE
ncbi:hypothetical protein BCR39DRAFT_391742 [Naematelia encephala]|uniref:Uncharacterized protein n=1 Tax=Naematelia encephala TaxID=71784 RepID=A0A1Y2AHN6_9TREE|nr:hypothetical protein BCR39DRAFT_391742 [Naematelia encephala]